MGNASSALKIDGESELVGNGVSGVKLHQTHCKSLPTEVENTTKASFGHGYHQFSCKITNLTETQGTRQNDKVMANQNPEIPMELGDIKANTNPSTTYATRLLAHQTTQNPSKTTLKPIELIHGEPTVIFTTEELRQFTVEEGLHQALVLKFSFERLDMQELRKLLPKLFVTKGRSLIGWLARRHILIRFDLYEDYVVAASKVVNYMLVNGENHQFRVFPWTLGFIPKEETSRAFVWISLPSLPPMLFAKKSLLSIALAVGKPIAINKATQETLRLSTARIKVELDLLDKKPNRVRIHCVYEITGQIIEQYQEVVYDSLPQFCSYCKHQGHEENSCHLLQQKHAFTERENPLYEGKIVEKYQGDLRNMLDEKKKAVDVLSTSNGGAPMTEKRSADGMTMLSLAEVVSQELKYLQRSYG
ncbi:uncharacterized protein [Nicotiana tomentosiformis]|uniref:uncharacterized protein n=1 Tax=Nicotiana tomentosiformis TaxID=4098 RepID=UPI00051C8B49|nr:uncharacterized protein LOC104118774 isoform X1 [Nicotiana tomentosiformis]